MVKAEVIKMIEEVGTDFGWQIGKVPVNYVNGYMAAVRDCKAKFYGNEVVTNADRIRNMSDEELLRVICELPDCVISRECPVVECHECIAEWLKEKVQR